MLVIRLRLPSFIVTLAGLLGLQGVLIWLVDKQGTGGAIPLHNNELYYLVNGNFTPLATIIFMIVIVAIASFSMLRADRNRRTSGLDTNTKVTITKIVLLAISGGLLIWIFNTSRSGFTTIDGMPFAIPIVPWLSSPPAASSSLPRPKRVATSTPLAETVKPLVARASYQPVRKSPWRFHLPLVSAPALRD